METTRKTAKLSTEILLSQKTSTLICLIQQVLNSNLFDKKVMKILDICYLRTSRLAIIKIIIKILNSNIDGKSFGNLCKQ
ncbi:hypothetical protein A6M08_03820 [Neisseria meningitidis]|uniref:Uncharacterized protein n=5 Tax=Neisseria meningitidis TaxID=487 RepID=A0AB37KDD0_NEIME|nr:hypothetical protein A6L28_01245 [Neisseria meningitidis]ANX30278.1 hypothetical protein A6L17_07200 [Neisseria meningitidis]ANX31278.1 hypothetical protein A6M06_00905 [Neisseria meningitidis]ANX34845.1 hypothetical protein A6L25_09610 [Neisseria meningitidis]ANX41111.1 hypothetical protein A6L41_09675 [Neisseria meningitidis]